MQKTFAAHRCPIKFVRSSLTCCRAFVIIRLRRWSMGKPSIFPFTTLPGKEYVEVHQ